MTCFLDEISLGTEAICTRAPLESKLIYRLIDYSLVNRLIIETELLTFTQLLLSLLRRIS